MDGNGKIDDYEFICGLALFTKTKQHQRIEAIFNIFDVDNSQTCDVKEFTALIETILRTGSSVDIKPDVLKSKLDQLKSKFFMQSDVVTLDSFSKIATDDADLRKCLIDIGVFSANNIDVTNYDDDLEAEMGKYILEEVDGAQGAPAIKIEGMNQLGMFDKEEQEAGDQFMAIKPFEGTVRNSVPSNYKPSKSDGDTPNASLKLNYVHGFRCHDTRNNIFYNPQGKLVYHTAQLGIQLDVDTNKQTFVNENVNDIISMDSWNNLSATGDITDKPALVIWDNITMQPLATLIGVLRKGIAMLAFSKDGKYIAASCMDTDSTICIFDVQKLIEGQRESKTSLIYRIKTLCLQGPKGKAT